MEKASVFGRNENVILNSRTFQTLSIGIDKDIMTFRGTVYKISFLAVIMMVSATWVWIALSRDGGFFIWMLLAALAAVIVGWITCASQQVAPYTAPVYAFLEGCVLGGLSALFEAEYPGLVIQAVFLTLATLLGLLVIYHVNGFHVTAKFRTGIVSAMLAILLVYVVNITLHLVGAVGIPFIHQSGLIGIGFSLFVVGIAALNLVLDFDLVEQGARQKAPGYMEWYCAFGVMVTLIWLYLEVLRLLALLAASSDDN